jgi:hypothetical protein
MIELPGFVLRQAELAQAAAWAGAEQADVVGDLGQRDREHVQHPRQLDQSVVARQRLEFVGRRFERELREVRHFGREGFGKALGGIEPGADRGAALRELKDARQHGLDPRDPAAICAA